MPTIIWSRLRDMKCPKCASDLRTSLLFSEYACVNQECRFTIGDEKFTEIVNSVYKGARKVHRVPDEMENLELLNNFDREPYSKDFSDRQPNV